MSVALFPFVTTRYTPLMGMFDEICCEAPLPDDYDPKGVWFQSKSIPDPCLCQYTITKAGRMVDSRGNDLEPEGYVNFYSNDWVEPGQTGGDASHCWREYRARFVEGQLESIVRVYDDTGDDRLYCGLASFRWFNTPPDGFW